MCLLPALALWLLSATTWNAWLGKASPGFLMLWISLCTLNFCREHWCVSWCDVVCVSHAGGSTPPLWSLLRWTLAHEWTRSISWQATSSPCLTCPTPSKCLLRMASERVQGAIPSPSPGYRVRTSQCVYVPWNIGICAIWDCAAHSQNLETVCQSHYCMAPVHNRNSGHRSSFYRV